MKITMVLLLVLWSCALLAQAPPPAGAPPQAPVNPQIKQAQLLNNQGKQDEALAILKPMLAADPRNYEANLNAGIVLDLKGDYTQARQYLKQAIEVAPADRQVQAWRTAAVSYAFTCDLPHVLDNERQAYEAQLAAGKNADAAATANELGRLYLDCGNTDDAAQWYQTGYTTARRDTKLTEADQDLWEFRYQSAKARIAARKGNKEEANADLAFALATLDRSKLPADQQRFRPYLSGYVALYTGDYKTAIDQLQKGDQKDPFVVALLAQAYEKSGNQDEAMKLYRQLLTFNLHNPSIAFARPLAKKKLGMAN